MTDLLPEAAERLAHRGPDDAGMFLDKENGVGLAHRRLSIIDLSAAGRQPMESDDGRVKIVYNGEVYNFGELRKTLEKSGHRFFSDTDTEVVLKSYLHWGIRCIDRFVGMFSLAIWDGSNRTCYLARDRLGIKPLYYYYKDSTLVFASELKAISAFSVLELNVDSDALALFFQYQYIPAPRTIYKNVYKLLPGSFLVYDGQNLRSESYWDLQGKSETNSPKDIDEEEALEQLASLLKKSVSCRLISDVPLGALLSGGIDSSLVVALMQEAHGSPVRTFSIGFENPEYNEAPDAAKIARHLGTDHTELYTTAEESLEVVSNLPEIYDEPFGDSSAIPTYLVCRMARSRLTVALSGDGGDEQFAGYVRYPATANLSRLFARFPAPLRGHFARMLSAVPVSWISRVYLPLRSHLPASFQFANLEDKWEKWLRQLSLTGLIEAYRASVCIFMKSDLQRLLGRQPPESRYEALFEKYRNMPEMGRMMRVDLGTYLPDAMLTKVDRASMAVGLEVRVPLLDHRVVEFSASLQDGMKYRNGEGKYLLKKLLNRYVPRELAQRPKKGFAVPIASWLQGALRPLLRDYLSTDRLEAEGRFETSYIERMVSEHLSGSGNHQHRLWCLLMWEMWRDYWQVS